MDAKDIGEVFTGKLLDVDGIFSILCRETRKWGVYLSWDNGHVIDLLEEGKIKDVVKEMEAVTNGRVDRETFHKGGGCFFFDTEQEMWDCYHDIVGDDGATERNGYMGPVRVYASTCSNEGEFWTENT